MTAYKQEIHIFERELVLLNKNICDDFEKNILMNRLHEQTYMNKTNIILSLHHLSLKAGKNATNMFLSGSTIPFLINGFNKVPNDIDIYCNSNIDFDFKFDGAKHTTFTHFGNKYNIYYSTGYHLRKIMNNVRYNEEIEKIVLFKLLKNGIELINIQFIVLYDKINVLDYLKKNDFDTVRTAVPLSNFEKIFTRVSSNEYTGDIYNYSELFDNIDDKPLLNIKRQIMNYMPSDKYFIDNGKFKFLDPVRMLRVYKYIQARQKIYYNGKQIEITDVRGHIDGQYSTNDIESQLVKIYLNLCDYNMYLHYVAKGGRCYLKISDFKDVYYFKFIEPFYRKYLQFVRYFNYNKKVNNIPLREKLFLTYNDYTNIYINALKAKKEEIKPQINGFTENSFNAVITRVYDFFRGSLSQRKEKTNGIIIHIGTQKYESEKTYDTDEEKNLSSKTVEILNKNDVVSIDARLNSTDEMIDDYDIEKHDKPDNGVLKKLFSKLKPILNNENAYISGGFAAELMNGPLAEDIDIFVSYYEMNDIVDKLKVVLGEPEKITMPVNSKNIFAIYNFNYLVTCAFFKHIIPGPMSSFINEKNFITKYTKFESDRTRLMLMVKDAEINGTIKHSYNDWAEKNIKVQVVVTTINPIEVITNFDFGASKGVFRIVDNVLENLTFPIYEEMIKKRVTTYDVLQYNLTIMNRLNRNSAYRLLKYYFKGYNIVVSQKTYDYLSTRYNIVNKVLTLENILTILEYTYFDKDQDQYYSTHNNDSEFRTHETVLSTIHNIFNTINSIKKIF